jgi:hypothetical protein
VELLLPLALDTTIRFPGNLQDDLLLLDRHDATIQADGRGIDPPPRICVAHCQTIGSHAAVLLLMMHKHVGVKTDA